MLHVLSKLVKARSHQYCGSHHTLKAHACRDEHVLATRAALILAAGEKQALIEACDKIAHALDRSINNN